MQWETEEVQQVAVPRFAPMGIGSGEEEGQLQTAGLLDQSNATKDTSAVGSRSPLLWRDDWSDLVNQLPEEVKAGQTCLMPEFYDRLAAVVVEKLPASPRVSGDQDSKEVPELFWEVNLAEVWEKLVMFARRIAQSSARISTTPSLLDYVNAWLLMRRTDPPGSPGDLEMKRVMDVWQQLVTTPCDLEKMSTVSRHPR